MWINKHVIIFRDHNEIFPSSFLFFFFEEIISREISTSRRSNHL